MKENKTLIKTKMKENKTHQSISKTGYTNKENNRNVKAQKTQPNIWGRSSHPKDALAVREGGSGGLGLMLVPGSSFCKTI